MLNRFAFEDANYLFGIHNSQDYDLLFQKVIPFIELEVGLNSEIG
jgi:hypothetical protein